MRRGSRPYILSAMMANRMGVIKTAFRGTVPPGLQADLDRLDSAGIPRDIVFEQGVSVLFGEL